MAKVQKDINPSMRAILIDWLVEKFVSLIRNLFDGIGCGGVQVCPRHAAFDNYYIYQYLSGNLMDRQRLQLLGVACMMITALWRNLDKIDNIQQLRKLEDSISKSLNEIAKHKGQLPDGQQIAVKRLSTQSRQGISEFKTENG
ncbi:hypothetical protein KY290_007444 [Solanum tuberosum]|uniref:Uncharacterized protein n=1 Tax=Solanum tuberosum TaxID=4113 RepID=A0ABQ7W5K9_SOLTU|nr:hypothetical protein KY290_007444 [Solanum tuberosum]